MKKRIAFLLIAVVAPALLWGFLGYTIYLEVLGENTYLRSFSFMENFLSQPLWAIILSLVPWYLISVSLGLIMYVDRRFWGVI
ncbi:MAG: hypothetical protein KGY65_04255 [Candidatus Thermoplasmatota archaeon]|nr:hypothetical protein [Candidatus Thermoplasmatota archaeon]MBS3801941.1 hypothetical protein [Candidatus Thermoplasmatota archaeon]